MTQSGQVENRLIDTPVGMPASVLVEASNYLNARLSGRTFDDARRLILEDLQLKRAELNEITARVIESGLATWAGEPGGALIVRGQARLLEDITAIADLERVRQLFDALERGESFARLLELANTAAGVQIFIGADNPLFANTDCSMVVAPVPRFAGTYPGRNRRDRPDAPQLCPHHPAGRLHRADHRAMVG